MVERVPTNPQTIHLITGKLIGISTSARPRERQTILKNDERFYPILAVVDGAWIAVMELKKAGCSPKRSKARREALNTTSESLQVIPSCITRLRIGRELDIFQPTASKFPELENDYHGAQPNHLYTLNF